MKVYNSLTFQKEMFKPLNSSKVLMYVCGPTVYDSPHLGHAKSAVVFDVIRRYLEFKDYKVEIVKNYTDIDDKIIKRAKERNQDYKELSEYYIKEYENIMQQMNIKEEDVNPRVTEAIDFIIEFVEKLIEKGHAYESNNSVYFSVNTLERYHTIFQNVEEEENQMEPIPEDEEPLFGDKYNPKDFALWKAKEKGEPSWKSPWGEGRPGWHIECSAMAIKYLGETIDIHGGGQDLKTPHHRNEIAQSTAYTGKDFFAKYFLHNGFVQIDDEKMSKSLGNFFLVSEIMEKFEPMVIRLFLLSSHYRSSINYSLDSMEQAQKNYEKLLNTIKIIDNSPVEEEDSPDAELIIQKLEKSREEIIKAMDNDFNTSVAIAKLLSLFREINRYILEKNTPLTEEFKDKFFSLVKMIENIFGIFPNLEERLALGVASSFDERGRIANELLKIINNLYFNFREDKIGSTIRNQLIEYFGKFPQEVEELALKKAGSFDKRGKTINRLLDVILDARKKLRDQKQYELSDEIREKLWDLGIKIEDR
ncbi:MAG: cysteine--tRNA ligase [Promethearchaeia archaeon]